MDPKRVSAVHQVPEGLEVTFFNAEAVLTFVEHAPAEWKVTTEVRVDGVVTVTPKFGTGHLLVPDAAIWAILERFDEVICDLRALHTSADAGEFKIETGQRVFRMKPNETSMPSALHFGKAAFAVHYKGMKGKCYKCQGPGHDARKCKEVVCFKCRGKGHMMKDCKQGPRCTICWCTGHTYEMCSKSKDLRVVLRHDWTEKDAPVLPYTPVEKEQSSP